MVIQESKSDGNFVIVNFLLDGLVLHAPQIVIVISKYNLSNRVAVKNKSM